MAELLNDLWSFMKERIKFWLFPIIKSSSGDGRTPEEFSASCECGLRSVPKAPITGAFLWSAFATMFFHFIPRLYRYGSTQNEDAQNETV